MTTLVAIGTRKGLWLARSEDRQAWTLEGPHLVGHEVAAACVDTRRDSVRLLATGHNQHWGPTLWVSDDLGGSWEEAPDGGVRFPEDTGAALGRIWQLLPDSPDRPGVVWAGVEPTSLWRSEDGGTSFSLVRGLWDHPHRKDWAPGAGGAAVHTVIPDPGSERVLVAMSTGGVYVSEDGASGWVPRNQGIAADFMPGNETPEYGQCVHKVAEDADGTLFAQNHGGVYRSGDRGATWESIADGLPSDFGFPVLASPRTAGTAWVVPLDGEAGRVPPHGRLRLHRTTDGGSSWQEVGAGLPDACWNAVVRDAACLDARDPTGVYVGTRGGDVWGSADEGSTFVPVAAGLPDVLVVRAVEIP